MGKVKIKHQSPQDNSTKLKLLELVAPFNIKINALHSSRDAIIVSTPSDFDSDELLSDKLTSPLEEHGFTAVLPPEVKASRSIICSKTDVMIYCHSEEEIATEIMRTNNWAKVIKVTKFGKSNLLKIQFEEIKMAQKALEGIKLFHLCISSQQIEAEKYINITTCFKCYALDAHLTKNCPKPKDYKICSECSSTEHIWKNCSTQTKKCINCGGEHRTLAMKCQKRKQLVKTKMATPQDSTIRPGTTYAQATHQSAHNSTSQTNNYSFSSIQQQDTKISEYMVLIMNAHLTEIAIPGSFNSTFEDSCKLNNLPIIKLPSNPPSGKIIQTLLPPIVTKHLTLSSANIPANSTPSSPHSQQAPLIATDTTSTAFDNHVSIPTPTNLPLGSSSLHTEPTSPVINILEGATALDIQNNDSQDEEPDFLEQEKRIRQTEIILLPSLWKPNKTYNTRELIRACKDNKAMVKKQQKILQQDAALDEVRTISEKFNNIQDLIMMATNEEEKFLLNSQENRKQTTLPPNTRPQRSKYENPAA